MADTRPSLGDAIRAAVPPVVQRCLPWWRKIPADTLAELEAVREDWRAGRLPGSKSALARAIAEELAARGISDVGRQGVTTWLDVD